MATTTQVSRPAPFVEKLGTNLAENVLAQQGVPLVSTGASGITQFAGEDADAFAARQKAGQAFDIRKQNLSGLAPQVAGQDQLQQTAQTLAQQGAGIDPTTGQKTGLASFEPFLQTAESQAGLAQGLGTLSLGQLGTAGQQLTGAGTTLSGVPLGAQAFQQDVSQFMSPYQSQVIDASLAEFDRNTQIQQQGLRDQQASLGALGSGRAGVQLAEFGTGAARERALLQAGLLQQGFGQAQSARQQDIQNRFGLGQAQAGLAGQRGALAGATQGLGSFQSGLAGQQAQFGAQTQALQGTDISRLGQLGALNQAQTQAELDATREATRQAAFSPQEQLDRYANQVTGIMGGYPGQTVSTNVPNPTPLQTALGVGTTLAGVYGGLTGKLTGNFNFNKQD